MFGASLGEAFGIASKGYVENLLSLFDDLPGHAVVQYLRCQKCDSVVMMFVVVPGKEFLPKSRRIHDIAGAIRRARAVP